MKKLTQRQKKIERIKKALDELINTSNKLGQTIPTDTVWNLEQRLDRLENS